MDKALKFICILLLCSPAFGAVVFVQDAGSSYSVTSSTTVSLTGTTAGNTLVVIALISHNTVDTAVCTDTKSDNYKLYAVSAGNGGSINICVAFNVAGGNVTATCASYSGSTYGMECYMAEYSGAYAADSVAYYSSGGSQTTSFSYSINTNLSGDMLIAAWVGGNTSSGTPGSGWTSRYTGTVAYQLATGAGAYTVNWSWSGSQYTASVAIALKAGSAPSVGTSPSTSFPSLMQSSGSSSSTCVYPNNVTSGDILVAEASVSSTTSLNNPSDSLSTSWTLVDSTSDNSVTKVWIGAASSTGAETITFSGYTGSINTSCVELKASLATTTVDAYTQGGFIGGPPILTTASLNTSVNGDTLLCFVSGNWGSGLSWPVAPMVYVGGAVGSMAAYQVLGAATPATCTFNTVNFTTGNYIVIAIEPASSITLSTASLPSALVSHSYSYPLYAVQGTGSYTWSVSSGNLPSGLSLSSSTGIISGTPTAGTQTFTAQVTDGTHTTTKSLTLTVNSSSSTPSYVQGVLNQSSTTLSFTSVGVGDILWVCAENHSYGGSGNLGNPTDTLSTVFSPIGAISSPGSGLTSISSGQVASTFCWGGQATSSGADTVTVASNLFTPAGFQIHNVQPFYDSTVFTTGLQTTANQTFTSTSLTTPAANSMSVGAVVVNYGSPSSITAQSPYTDAGSITGDNHIVDLGYDLVSSVGNTAFSSAIVSGSTSATWNMAMTNLRPTTSGAIASTTHYFPQMR